MVDEDDDEKADNSYSSRTTVWIKNYFSNVSAVGIGEVAKKINRTQYLGFCESPECVLQGVLYRVEGRTRALITKDAEVIDCPSCEHALFWSNKYKKSKRSL